MAKDQLFKKIPDDELFNHILKLYGISDLNQNYTFTKYDLQNIRTIENMNLIRDKLSECYLPCKFKHYLDIKDEKDLVTILRQILKTRNYKLVSKEKYMKGKKYLIYKIESDEDFKITINNELNTDIQSKNSILVRFD
jgi:hypothetical protein